MSDKFSVIPGLIWKRLDSKFKSLKKIVSKPAKIKTGVKSKFAAFRAQMKIQKADDSVCEKVFDAGFFKVASPQKTPTPHCVTGSTPTKILVKVDSSESLQSPAHVVPKINFIDASTPIPPLINRTPRRKSYVPAVPSPLLCDITPGRAKSRRSYRNTPIPKKLLRRSEGAEVSNRSPIKTRRRSRSSAVSSPQAAQDTNKESADDSLKFEFENLVQNGSLKLPEDDHDENLWKSPLPSDSAVKSQSFSTLANTSLKLEEEKEHLSKSALAPNTGNQKEKKTMKCVSFCDTENTSIQFDTEADNDENNRSSYAQLLALETETPAKIDDVSEQPKSALKRSKTPQSGRRKSARLSVHFAPSPHKEEFSNLQPAPVTPFNRNMLVPRSRVNSGSSENSSLLNSPLSQKENSPITKLNFTESNSIISTPLGNTNRKEVLDSDLMSFSPL